MREIAYSIYRYRSLLWTLTARELKARYRGSALGYLWSLINPLLLLLVYSFVFGKVLGSRDSTVSPYGLFLVTGVMPWIWFQTSLMEGCNSLMANAGLIRKATFPAELLPLVPVLANLLQFVLALPIIGGGFLLAKYWGYSPGGWSVLWLPLLILAMLPMISGLALALAALNTHFKDVKDILANLLTLLFFMTPILYTLDLVRKFPKILPVVEYNPFTPAILACQEALFFGRSPSVGLWLQLLVTSAVFWFAGCWLFDRLRDTLAEAV